MRALALRLVEMGDRDAAHEQVRATLTSVARALILGARTFPLARSELVHQLRDLGQPALSVALSRAIYFEPSLDELGEDLQLLDAVLAPR